MSALTTLKRGTQIQTKRAGGWLLSRLGDELARLAYQPWQNDPYPLYARMRAAGPLYRSRTGMLAVPTYRDCEAILRDQRFGVQFTDGQVGGSRGLGIPPEYKPQPSLAELDPPEHTRLRSLARTAFTSRKVAGYRPMVWKIAEELVDAAAERGEFDLITDLAEPLSIRIVCALLGIPDVDVNRFAHYGRVFGSALGGIRSPRHMNEVVAASAAVADMFSRLIEERTANPREDIITSLVQAAGDGRLTADEMMVTAKVLMIAGFETTTNLTGNGVHALLHNPEAWSALREDPQLASAVVNETLRYDAPVQLIQRIAQQDVELHGQRIRADTVVLLLLGATGRDPEAYADPDRFDVRRKGTRDALSFGGGVHYCLGALLARLEGEAAFAVLAERLPRLRLVGTPRRRNSAVVRGFHRLPAAVR